MTWQPRGPIFPSGTAPSWTGGYAALPFAVAGQGRSARVYFTGRDEQNRSQIGACTLDLDTFAVTDVTPQPLLARGPLGAFDDSGCSVSCVVEMEGVTYLYYTGWALGRTVPFYLATGLAVSEDHGRTFRRHSPAPILDRTAADPFLNASPSVLREGGLWRMWYVSATEWENRPEGPRHRYLIKYAESDDGIQWRRDGHVALPFVDAGEYAMGRPHIVREGSTYTLWTCVRGEQYRIVRAESPDGLHWTRSAGFVPPARGSWDSMMQAYPMHLQDGERSVLFYNGNGYGATGFGVAVAEGRS
jgi:hypothetical protein